MNLLEKTYDVVAKKGTPTYPYDPESEAIDLPGDVDKRLQHLVAEGNKPEAIREVVKLTGAGLRISKAYVDRLERKIPRCRAKH